MGRCAYRRKPKRLPAEADLWEEAQAPQALTGRSAAGENLRDLGSEKLIFLYKIAFRTRPNPFFSRLRRAILLSMQSYHNIVIAFSKGKLPVHTIHNSRNEKTCFCRERNSKSAVLHHAMVIVYQYVLDFSIGSIGKVYLFRRLNCMIEMISRRSIQSGRLIRHT